MWKSAVFVDAVLGDVQEQKAEETTNASHLRGR